MLVSKVVSCIFHSIFFTNEWFKHHLEYNDYIIISQKTQPSLKEPQKNCQGTWTKSVGRILVGTLVSDLDIFNLRPCLGGKSMLMLRDVARCWSVNSVRPFWSIRKCNFDAASSKNLVRSACIFFLASKAKVSVFCKKCQTIWNTNISLWQGWKSDNQSNQSSQSDERPGFHSLFLQVPHLLQWNCQAVPERALELGSFGMFASTRRPDRWCTRWIKMIWRVLFLSRKG